MTTTSASYRSLWNRKADAAYFAFFVTHIIVMLVVDLVPYYPTNFQPSFTVSLRKWYIATYRDRFFTHPPAWFHGYMALELFYHIPLSLWAIKALLEDDPMVPVHLLIFALETGVTTFTCVLEMLSWDQYSREEKTQLCSLYLPYLALASFMGTDMFNRLKNVIRSKSKTV